MKFSDNEKVNNFLSDLQLTSPGKLETLEAIRAVFKSLSADLAEDIKYGGVVYSLSGALIGGIFPYAHHISIEFSNGSKFADPEEVLEGKGKKRRHIKIINKSDIEEKNISIYVKQAVEDQ